MRHVDIGGTRMPKLGFGTWQLRDRRCRDAVGHALAVGYRHLDTAQLYGNETEVGAAMRMSRLDRGELFVTTKLAPENLTPQAVHDSTRESLARLHCDYLDLLLIHWPNPEVPLADTLGAMMALRDEGLILQLGVSNFSPALLEEAIALAPIVAHQLEYHPYLAQPELLRIARETQSALIAYCPLAQGRAVRDGLLAEIGAAHGKTPAQVALAWLLQQQPVAAIPRSSSRQHIEENFAVFDFSLSEQEMQRIQDLDCQQRLIDPPHAPDWSARPRQDDRAEKRSRRAPRTERYVGLSQPAGRGWIPDA